MNRLTQITVSVTWRVGTTGSGCSDFSTSSVVKHPAAQVAASAAGELARLVAINNGDDEIVLAEVQAALQRVREWRRDQRKC